MTLIVETAYGWVEGVDDCAPRGTYAWKGIPFAQPPVGELRWRAPREPEPWKGLRPARVFGPSPAQPGSVFGPGRNNTWDATVAATLNQPVGSEDCLYLNIWRPADEDRDLPVIFFLHGGSNLYGYAADPLYDGAALAKAAHAVVVTANYRLGLFGWLSLAPLRTEDDPLGTSGNFGTLDQIQALRFVSGNIARFGGDPGNVTVIGQSSGAVNLTTLLTSPQVVQAEPQLFHRAMLLSGGAALPSELPPGAIATLRPSEYAERQGQALLAWLLATDGLAEDEASAAGVIASMTSAELAFYLRSKTPAELFRQLFFRLAPAGLMTIAHNPEGTVVAASPLAAIKAGQYLKVPIVLGITRDEARLFPSWLALSPALGGVPGLVLNDAALAGLLLTYEAEGPEPLAVADVLNTAYLPADAPGTGYHARTDLLNQFFFIALRNATAEAFATQGAAFWHFRFDWAQEPAPWDQVYGAAHVFDLPFLFGNFEGWAFSRVMNSRANEGGRKALAEAMMAMVGAFARTGDPNHEGLGVAWPAWPKTLVFDGELAGARISIQ